MATFSEDFLPCTSFEEFCDVASKIKKNLTLVNTYKILNLLIKIFTLIFILKIK